MNRIVFGMALLLGAVAINPGYADKVDQRQENQANRIEQGAESGALNDKEQRRLEAGQRRINAVEQRAEADGVVTPGEKHRLNQMQKHQNRKIHRLKHNKR